MAYEFRLHIDIPLGSDEEKALKLANSIMEWWATSESSKADLKNMGIQSVNYRVGNDEDRQKSNYLVKNENGHVNNKKCRLVLDNTN